MPTKRIPFTPGLHIEEFSGSSITKSSSYMHNTILDKYGPGGEDRVYLTQRPGIDLSLDVSEESGIDAIGRGIYYWADAESPDRYFCSNNDLFAGTANIGSISSGFLPVTFVEGLDGSGNRLLCVFDKDNSEGWTIATNNTVTQITDVDFPPEQTPAKTLAYGAVNLDGYIFVLTQDGQIWNSDLDDATSWNALNFIEAEREPDDGVWIGKHHSKIVVLNGRTTEFFYNAANPTGSPLSRRNDIFFNVGCADGASVWADGDVIYFLGINTRGTVGVYKIEDFSISKVSNGDLDSYLTQSRIGDGLGIMGAGFSAGGHTYYSLTIYSDNDTSATPIITLVYDTAVGEWGTWDSELSQLSGIKGIPLVSWSIRTGTAPRFGEGILTNGDIITINDSNNTFDSLAARVYIDNDTPGSLYVDAGYYTDVPSSGTAISWNAKISHQDMGTTNAKFLSRIDIIADPTESSETLTIEWGDGEDHDSFDVTRTLDLSSQKRLTKCGSFNRRTFQLSGTNDEKVRIEGLELKYSVGSR